MYLPLRPVVQCGGQFKSFKPFNRFAPFKSFNQTQRGTSIRGEFKHYSAASTAPA
jgi:hypothetical protein